MSIPTIPRNPEPLRDFLAGRRIRASNGGFLKAFRDAMVEAHGGLCTYCGEEASGDAASIDHVTPVAAGGSDALDNLVLACRTCNYGKGSRTLEDFRITLAIRFSPLAGIITGSQAQLLLHAGAVLPVDFDVRFRFEEALEATR